MGLYNLMAMETVKKVKYVRVYTMKIYVQMYANMYKFEQYVKIYIYVQQVHL